MKRMLVIIMIMSLVATSVSALFPLYHRSYGLNSIELSLLFVSYAVVLLPVLLVAGARGAYWGLKKVVRISIWLSFASALLFLFSQAAWMLYAARMLEGVAYGLFTGVAVPFLLRNSSAERAGKAVLLSGIAVSIGLGIGPAASGLLAQYIPVLQERLPYGLGLVLLLASAAMIETLPTAEKAGGRPGSITLGVPKLIGRNFWSMSALPIFIVFSLNGVVLSLLPTFVTTVLHSSNLSISGILALLVLGGGALLQLLPWPARPVVRLRAGLVILAAGAWLIVLSGMENSIALLWLGVCLQALGSGWTFQVSLRLAGEMPQPQDRPRVITTYYLAGYFGFIVPGIGLGLLSYLFSMSIAMAALNAVGLLLALYTIVYSLRFKREYGMPRDRQRAASATES